MTEHHVQVIIEVNGIDTPVIVNALCPDCNAKLKVKTVRVPNVTTPWMDPGGMVQAAKQLKGLAYCHDCMKQQELHAFWGAQA